MSRELKAFKEFAYSFQSMSGSVIERIAMLSEGDIDGGDGFSETLEIFLEMYREILIIAASKSLESDNLLKFTKYLDHLEEQTFLGTKNYCPPEEDLDVDDDYNLN